MDPKQERPGNHAPEPDGRGPAWLPNRLGMLVLAALVSLGLLSSLLFRGPGSEQLSYSEFKRRVESGQVREVVVSPSRVQGKLAPGPDGKARSFEANRIDDPKLLEELQAHHVEASGSREESGLVGLLDWVLPLAAPLLLLVLLGRALSRQPGANAGLMGVGQSKARVYVEQDIPVRFTDVAGVDEAKAELAEVVEFLRTPEKYARLGGHVPKGVLLVGPPGTGKTLLARAVAGEAKVPFFSISGSEFVEMFVGVGAARVRDLFEQAKKAAPCIIFIDELDALGKARGAGPMAHEEREQTLNQLLVEMDGFDPRAGVILMAATNRPEILDPALLRAGRFDRHVLVDRPDKGGRLAILQLHARKVKLAPDADLEALASLTPGMAGADLANVINEAALLAVRRDKEAVGRAELSEAVERVVAGLEKRSRVLRPEEKERVAYHEVGHALVGLLLPGLGVVQKVSVIPRGVAALGFTMQAPTEDRFLLTRSELENKLASLLGGRAAEELIFGEESTGAADDLQKATRLARSMVVDYGMSEAVGTVSLAPEQQPTLLGLDLGESPHGPELARVVDEEVRRILEEQHLRARRLLTEHREALRQAALRLLKQETLLGEELREVVERYAPRAQPLLPV